MTEKTMNTLLYQYKTLSEMYIQRTLLKEFTAEELNDAVRSEKTEVIPKASKTDKFTQCIDRALVEYAIHFAEDNGYAHMKSDDNEMVLICLQEGYKNTTSEAVVVVETGSEPTIIPLEWEESINADYLGIGGHAFCHNWIS